MCPLLSILQIVIKHYMFYVLVQCTSVET